MKEIISTKHSIFFALIVFMLMAIMINFSTNDDKYKLTCTSHFEGKIIRHSTFGGIVGVKISGNDKLVFSLLSNKTDSFYQYIHVGMYLKKEKNSNIILMSEDSLFRFKNKSWLIICNGF